VEAGWLAGWLRVAGQWRWFGGGVFWFAREVLGEAWLLVCVLRFSRCSSLSNTCNGSSIATVMLFTVYDYCNIYYAEDKPSLSRIINGLCMEVEVIGLISAGSVTIQSRWYDRHCCNCRMVILMTQPIRTML